MRLERDLEAGPVHRELGQRHGDLLFELRRRGRARLREPLPELHPLRLGLGERRVELGTPLARPLETIELGAAVLGVGQHRSGAAAVLAHQPLDLVEPRLDLLEPSRLRLDPVDVAA